MSIHQRQYKQEEQKLALQNFLASLLAAGLSLYTSPLPYIGFANLTAPSLQQALHAIQQSKLILKYIVIQRHGAEAAGAHAHSAIAACMAAGEKLQQLPAQGP